MLYNSSKNSSFPSPSHQLKIHRPLSTPNNQPNKVTPRGKRHPPKPTYLKSPYIVRALDITTWLSQSNKCLSEWVFSTQGSPSDEVFRTCVGVSAQRFHMESFFNDCELFGHVLDCWSHLLNLDEDLRDDLSPRRLFAPITVTVISKLTHTFNIHTFTLNFMFNHYSLMTAEARKSLFFSNLSVDCIDDEGLTLRDVRLHYMYVLIHQHQFSFQLFLPVVRDFHIFLFVIDLQQPSFTIIDNIRQDDTHQVAYGVLPDLVVDFNLLKASILQESAEFQSLHRS
uniref:Uncharacterized protein n=1 Tax=Lactuca sativa TaxID=4236 RepID=A0A9R1W7X2_LACSA|nr:hypothetical protein LSAT_V11C300128430 [Lactuca sativa]